MKVALVHDFLCGIGGSERVFQYLSEAFPDADLYTTAYNPERTLPYFKTRRIHTTWLNRFVQTPDAFRWSFPLATRAMQSLNFSDYDLVLSSSATVAKYIRTSRGRHICYCYFPTRALWHFDRYFANSWKKTLLKPLLSFLQTRDWKAAQRIDHFIAISDDSKKAIQSYYGREADVLACPIETEKFIPLEIQRQDHYLLVSRLEKWKEVDYAIDAFNRSGKRLRIIGTGAEEGALRRQAEPNITFLGEVDDQQLVYEYNLCKAVVFTPLLEFGLIPLEANACGTPVICYGGGGVLETMVPYRTAIFFSKRNSEELNKAIELFESNSFDPNVVVHHASKWSVPTFQELIRKKISQTMSVHCL